MSYVKHQLDDTTNIMHANIESAMERGERLGDLEVATGNLAAFSAQFQRNTQQVEQNMFWKHKRALLTSFVVIAILIAVGIWGFSTVFT